MHDAFLVAAIVAFAGVIVAVFLPEKPLRGRQEVPALEEVGRDLAVEGIGTAAMIPAGNEPRPCVAHVQDMADKHAPENHQPVGGRSRID